MFVTACWAFVRAGRPGGFTPLVFRVQGWVLATCILPVEYYVGFYSPMTVVLSLGIYYLGQSTDSVHAFWLPIYVAVTLDHRRAVDHQRRDGGPQRVLVERADCLLAGVHGDRRGRRPDDHDVDGARGAHQRAAGDHRQQRRAARGAEARSAARRSAQPARPRVARCGRQAGPPQRRRRGQLPTRARDRRGRDGRGLRRRARRERRTGRDQAAAQRHARARGHGRALSARGGGVRALPASEPGQGARRRPDGRAERRSW